jgi:outer membrane protein OmpA-like peptidoglycan-associated protein
MKRKVLAISMSMVVSAWSGSAAAETGFSLHVEGGVARAVGGSSDMFGWGGAGLITPELVLHPAIGIEFPLGVVGLATSPEANPAFARTASGSAFVALTGLRLHPLIGRLGGLGDAVWIAGGGGLADTSGLLAPALDLRLGADLRVGQVALGPFAGYLQLINLHGGARPDDGRMMLFGLHGSFGPSRFSSPRAALPEPLRAPSPEAPVEPDTSTSEVSLAPLVPVLEAPLAPVARAPVETRRELVEPIHFVFHRAEITKEGMQVVLLAAEILRAHPEIAVARVIGHSDESGDSAYNMRLSEQRAQAVVAALIREGVEHWRLEVAYYGKDRPRRRELGLGAQQENRRVEIEIRDPGKASAPALDKEGGAR